MESKKNLLFQNYQLIQAVEGIPCNLGFGAYGSVQLGKCLKTKQTVAIKKIGKKLAHNEVEIHLKLNHPNIIKMLDYYFDEKVECTYIILQYAQNGTLFDYIRENGLKDKRMIKGFFLSVCQAIDYMHSKNIMHRDIKPENILLDRKNNVKLCDFGFSTNCEPRMTLCGTVEYMAPQMILRKPYNHKIDVWGLGILLFEMIEGRPPFQGQTQQQVLERMEKKSLFFSKNFTADQIELTQKILKVDPKQRPEVKDIIRSPCLQINSKAIQENKRSTADQDSKVEPKGSYEKKIRILEVIDLKKEKAQKIQRPQKKSSSYNIEITGIRDLNPGEQSLMSTSSTSIKQKVERHLSTYVGSTSSMGGKEKISLKKVARKS